MSELVINKGIDGFILSEIYNYDVDGIDEVDIEINDSYMSTTISLNKQDAIAIINHLKQQFNI